MLQEKPKMKGKMDIRELINHNVLFGTIGTATTFLASHFNYALGCFAGMLTVGILLIRIRKEWRHRNE
jgi:hypothetical protein